MSLEGASEDRGRQRITVEGMYGLVAEFRESQARLEERLTTAIREGRQTQTAVENGLAAINAKIDKNYETLEERVRTVERSYVKSADLAALGTRLSAVETDSISNKQVQAHSVSTWLWLWGALIATPGFITTILNLIRLAQGH